MTKFGPKKVIFDFAEKKRKSNFSEARDYASRKIRKI